MKKILVFMLVIGVFMSSLMIGCCSIQQTDGTTNKSFWNCFTKSQYVICNADQATVSAVDVFLNFVKPFISTTVPGSALALAYLTATNIKTYGCAAVTDLNTLITFIQGLNIAQEDQTKMAGKKMTKPLLPVTPIINWKNANK